MKIYKSDDCAELFKRGGFGDEKLNAIVKEIVSSVKERGDEAVFEYEKKFDLSDLNEGNFKVSEEEIAAAYEQVEPQLLESLRLAIDNILKYHTRNKREDDVRVDELGRKVGYVVRPVSRAGIYVPGGTAPLSSSVCMGVLPARAAGVKEIYVTTPAKKGVIHPLTIVAAVECGATAIYKVGGAQAIAALAYGTKSVPKVDVIAGPGNIFVTLAKKEVYGQVGIDMLAGPSEILIIADKNAKAKYVAADMLSQAEHDKLSRAIVLTDSEELAKSLETQVKEQLEVLPRREIAEYSVENSGGVILCKDLEEAVALSNAIAPEHLEIYTENAEELLTKVTAAGAVFVGGYTPEPVGDYFAGPDHILPTGGTAKFFEVLNQDIFVRKMSVISYGKEAIMRDGEHIIRLAESEGLEAHANAVRVRLGK